MISYKLRIEVLCYWKYCNYVLIWDRSDSSTCDFHKQKFFSEVVQPNLVQCDIAVGKLFDLPNTQSSEFVQIQTNALGGLV